MYNENGITESWISAPRSILRSSVKLIGVLYLGLVIMSVVLTAVGLPVEAIAIVAGVDKLMDMGRTAINVFGNAFAVLLLDKLFGKELAEEGPTA